MGVGLDVCCHLFMDVGYSLPLGGGCGEVIYIRGEVTSDEGEGSNGGVECDSCYVVAFIIVGDGPCALLVP